MMLFPVGVRVWIAAGHTDMRRGMYSLNYLFRLLDAPTPRTAMLPRRQAG
jgi:hypothetical protein